MPLHIDPPQDPDALQQQILRSLQGTFGDTITLSAPYRLVTADLRALARGELLLSSDDRWQCLVGAGEPMAAVDVVREGAGYEVVSVNHGRLATRFNDAVRLAEDSLGESDHALSGVEIPRLHLAAARLVPMVAGTELYIPVLPLVTNTSTIEPLRIYSVDELVDVLQAEARRALDEGLLA